MKGFPFWQNFLGTCICFASGQDFLGYGGGCVFPEYFGKVLTVLAIGIEIQLVLYDGMEEGSKLPPAKAQLFFSGK